MHRAARRAGWSWEGAAGLAEAEPEPRQERCRRARKHVATDEWRQLRGSQLPGLGRGSRPPASTQLTGCRVSRRHMCQQQAEVFPAGSFLRTATLAAAGKTSGPGGGWARGSQTRSPIQRTKLFWGLDWPGGCEHSLPRGISGRGPRAALLSLFRIRNAITSRTFGGANGHGGFSTCERVVPSPDKPEACAAKARPCPPHQWTSRDSHRSLRMERTPVATG